MRGHALSGTRKLNRHWQSGNRGYYINPWSGKSHGFPKFAANLIDVSKSNSSQYGLPYFGRWAQFPIDYNRSYQVPTGQKAEYWAFQSMGGFRTAGRPSNTQEHPDDAGYTSLHGMGKDQCGKITLTLKKPDGIPDIYLMGVGMAYRSSVSFNSDDTNPVRPIYFGCGKWENDDIAIKFKPDATDIEYYSGNVIKSKTSAILFNKPIEIYVHIKKISEYTQSIVLCTGTQAPRYDTSMVFAFNDHLITDDDVAVMAEGFNLKLSVKFSTISLEDFDNEYTAGSEEP